MNRKMYQPTEKQQSQWASWTAPQLPSDDEFKSMWKKSHGGKITGWGMKKRDYIIGAMTSSPNYQMGIWQGRVDRACGLDYSEERNENTYNLGYYRGYTEYESNRRGWDAATRADFDAKYLSD